MSAPAGPIPVEQFAAVELRVGTVRAVRPNERARLPAYVLEIDLGPLGRRTSSARVTEGYRADELIGRQVVVVANLPPRRVAGVVSEVLVLAAVSERAGVVLLSPDRAVEDGTRVA